MRNKDQAYYICVVVNPQQFSTGRIKFIWIANAITTAKKERANCLKISILCKFNPKQYDSWQSKAMNFKHHQFIFFTANCYIYTQSLMPDANVNQSVINQQTTNVNLKD